MLTNYFYFSILSSRIFKFIVGETSDGAPTEFSVHEEAIAQLSQPLRSLLTGGMSEAQTGCVIWEHVGKGTFERFVQFAYTGDYSIPTPTVRKKTRGNREPEPISSAENLDWDSFAPKKSKKGKKRESKEMAMIEDAFHMDAAELDPPEPHAEHSIASEYQGAPWSSQLPTADFQSLQYPLITVRNRYENTCEPDESFFTKRSYSNVFLAHASLYVLGDYKLIDSLKRLALYKLHKTLCNFQHNNENAQDIVDLANYVYSEEGKGSGEGIGELRSLVCQYMAQNAVGLSVDDKFMDLLGEGGQFVKDFFKFELQRVH